MMFRGTIVALVTPFKDGKVDYQAFRELLDFHKQNKTSGILIGGTTGEAPTISVEELHNLFKIAVEMLKNKIPLLAGTGTNNTKLALQKTIMAKEAGMDGALVVTPYYNKPPMESLVEHFTYIAKKAKFPVIIYNVPGRTGSNITPETVYKLSKIKNIIGIKEATGSMKQAIEIKNLVSEKFLMLSGDDLTLLPFLSIGGHGVISVTANIIPKKVNKVIELFKAGKINEARKLHNKLYKLHKAMFLTTNPIPIKTAMYLMGMIENEFRLPLTPMSNELQDKLRDILINQDLLWKK